jgi:hypothetical protein
MRAAPGADDGVDLVDDHGPHASQHLTAAFGGQEKVQRLRRGDQNVWRRSQHRRAFRGARVAGADGGRNPRRAQPGVLRRLADSSSGLGKILVDVGAECLQRRDVQDAHLIDQRLRRPFFDEIIDGREKSRERFARARRCGNQRVPALPDRLPAPQLS